MTAIIAALIPLIPSLIQIGQAGISFIAQIKTAAQQTGEWSDAADKAFTDGLANMATQPQWQPDPPAK